MPKNKPRKNRKKAIIKAVKPPITQNTNEPTPLWQKILIGIAITCLLISIPFCSWDRDDKNPISMTFLAISGIIIGFLRFYQWGHTKEKN